MASLRALTVAGSLAAALAGCISVPLDALQADGERPPLRTRLGDGRDTCADLPLFVEGLYGARVRVAPGEESEVRVPGSTFRWSCGAPARLQRAPAGTNLVVVTRSGSDVVRWVYYREGG